MALQSPWPSSGRKTPDTPPRESSLCYLLVLGLGLKISGLVSKVSCFRFRVEGSGLREDHLTGGKWGRAAENTGASIRNYMAKPDNRLKPKS